MCQPFWELYAPEIEADRKDSEKRGMEIGERRGERRSLISLIIKKIQRGMDILFIADALEESEEVIRPIYEAVLASPDAGVDQIYESLYAK